MFLLLILILYFSYYLLFVLLLIYGFVDINKAIDKKQKSILPHFESTVREAQLGFNFLPTHRPLLEAGRKSLYEEVAFQ